MIEQLSVWDGIFVPAAGEVVKEQGTNKIKIGDGKTDFANLPYVDDNPSERKDAISPRVKKFIEENIVLIENDDYDTLYSQITNPLFAREVTVELFKSGLNPKPHVSKIPAGCASVFYYEGEDPNETNKQRGWANISYPNRGKTQYTWITTAPNNGQHWDEYIIDYDIDKEVETIKKEIEYLSSWTLGG